MPMKARIIICSLTATLPLLSMAQKRPNILYIMTDQQAAMAMSCMGNPYVNTPHMDRLAARGMMFVNAYCAFPLSGPSRASMFTGYMPSEVGMQENGKPLPDSLCQETLGTVLRSGGYECAYAGKWHVNTNELPAKEAFGFDKLHGHDDKGLAEACVSFLRRKHDKPFFLVASFNNPHGICEFARGQNPPAGRIEERKADDRPPLPANFTRNPYDASALTYEKKFSLKMYPTADYTPDDWRNYLDAYYQLVENVDAEIGKIVDELDRQRLWDNTLVVFTSDHGDGCAAHQWNQKTALYENVASIPLIVCMPRGKNRGKVMTQLVNNGEDLMPTLCDFAGIAMPKGRSGKSWRVALERGDSSVTIHPYVVTETNFAQTAGTLGWMVRTPRYKYVMYDTGKNREQLFDMSNDRGEMINLAVTSKYRDVLRAHRRMLAEWMQKHPSGATRLKAKWLPTDR